MAQVPQQQTFPHIELLELYNDGLVYETAVVKRDKSNGDVYFIRIDYLDEIDRGRLRKILTKRDAAKYELWDLLGNETLGNGQNALEFFHQLVKVKTLSGKIFNPALGKFGAQRALVENTPKRGKQSNNPQS